jgi:predicted lipoprotein with Yx(FWY)xxD motif
MVRPILAAVALAALVAACSTGVGGPTATPASSPTAKSAPTTGAVSVEVTVASSSLGSHLVGPDGKALYLLTTDTANTSTCSGDCATNWPPLVVEDPTAATAGSGVTGTIGTFARGDTNQVAINDVPLYYFAGDTAAGEIKGQGLGGVWFVVAPDGTALQAAGSSAPAGPSMTPPDPYGDGGYGDGDYN